MPLSVTKECTLHASDGRPGSAATSRGGSSMGPDMLCQRLRFLFLISLLVLLSLGGSDALAQQNVAEFQEVLGDTLILETSDVTLLEQDETVTKLLPARDKREIAM
jgi:hypothetical protein